MNKIKVLNIIIFIFIWNTSCQTSQKEKFSTVSKKGNISVNLKGEKSGYKWKFERNVSYQLKIENYINSNDFKLVNIESIDSGIVGLDWKNSRILFYDSSLNLNSFWPSISPNSQLLKNIQYYDNYDSILFVYDFASQSINNFSIKKNDEKLLSTTKLLTKTPVFKLCQFKKDTLLYIKSSDTEFKFYYSNIVSKKQLDSFALNNTPPFPQLVLDGSFLKDYDSKYLVYYCYYTGLYMLFDTNIISSPLILRTIDQTPVPIAFNREISAGIYKLDIKPNIKYFQSASLYKNYLYILNNINEEHEYIIDVYDLISKKYSYSTYLPVFKKSIPISITVLGESCFILYRNGIILKTSLIKI